MASVFHLLFTGNEKQSLKRVLRLGKTTPNRGNCNGMKKCDSGELPSRRFKLVFQPPIFNRAVELGTAPSALFEEVLVNQ
jgi:hypothetical protein